MHPLKKLGLNCCVTLIAFAALASADSSHKAKAPIHTAVPVKPIFRPAHHNRLAGVMKDKNLLVFSDGSEWKLSDSEMETAKDWSSGDIIIVSPNTTLFSGEDYCLTNQSTATYVRADWNKVALKGTSEGHWLVHRDEEDESVLYLENGSKYQTADGEVLSGWKPGDMVIIGENAGMWSKLFHSSIIINTRTNEYIRVNQL